VRHATVEIETHVVDKQIVAFVSLRVGDVSTYAKLRPDIVTDVLPLCGAL
jgi:hypothetical protein